MNWLYTLWFGYFWPSLKGNGPEALVQTVVYGVIAIIFVPPVRRWFAGHMNAVHAKLDHIIKHHPAIPPFTPGPPQTTTSPATASLAQDTPPDAASPSAG